MVSLSLLLLLFLPDNTTEALDSYTLNTYWLDDEMNELTFTRATSSSHNSVG